MALERTSTVELARERTIQALCYHFAHDRLTTEQVDQRLERAQKARSIPELQTLLADLPMSDAESLEAESAREFALARPLDVAQEERMMAVMGEVKRSGVWTPPRRLKLFALMSSATIDLRETRFPPGVTEIDIFAVMAEVKVIVPPGVRVESNGTAIMAAFSGDAIDSYSDDPDAPTVRLTGHAIMAEVRARVRAVKHRLRRGRPLENGTE
jgi:hypothetical protein